MVRLTPRSEYGRRRANPRQAGWATSKSVGSRCAAKPIGERWRPRGGDPDHGNAVRPLPPMFPDPAVRALVDGPAGYMARPVRTRLAAPSACHRKACRGRGEPKSNHEWRHAFVYDVAPWPMIETWRRAGHSRGNHSASSSPGLHASPERGIKTITGSEGAPRNRLPAKAHGSAAPPSLLSIRIYAEKESHPALSNIGRLTVTRKIEKSSLCLESLRNHGKPAARIVRLRWRRRKRLKY
jgi:hypothetical protein